MQIGMIGLGRMGGNMAERLRHAGHEVVGYDRDPAVSDVASLAELARRLEAPRTVWVMVPAGGPTRETIKELGGLLAAGDLVVDGGNSHYVDDLEHARELSAADIRFVDTGVSGGVWGLANGYGLMAGGADEDIARLMPVFEALKPAGDYGFVHAGKVGAGHFAKMVHNGIEYGIMQAYAEGYELLAATDVVTDVPGSFRSWREGTVIRSWLLDLLVRALDEDAGLAKIKGVVEDSGEGRWTVQAAIDHAVPMPAISAALFARFSSRQEDSPAARVVAALRNQFGGHAVISTTAKPPAPPSADSPG
ncbi:MAG TPA: decarboxylating 6-phosphogluconate dehydrogenase [Streptosporangiaceae bacterium]|jgi:6-phosphogluconate dehydrogenase|nr:decarboxylating 6-phosphogluconate dehydrogenase [Streptosporangiaceae bacterium]